MPLGKKASALSFSALLLAPLVGCGGSSSKIPSLNALGPSGKVTQGAISGSTVWADGVGSGVSFLIDTAEQGTSTKTSSTGTYTIPTTPSYKYLLISQGGIDTITGKTALSLLSPGGAQSVSPLTTLVALDVSGNLSTALTSLLPSGKTYDSDLTAPGALSPAAMVFVTSVTTAFTTFQQAIQDATAKGNATLSAQQLNYINLTLFSQMAIQFSSVPSASLANTADLAKNLQISMCNAVNVITASSANSNITGLNCSLAATIANASVAVAANIVGNATDNAALKSVTASNVQTTPVTVTTTGTLTEAAVLAIAGNTSLVIGVINTTATSVATGITVTSTPPGYTPPAIPTINNPSVIGYNLVAVQSGNVWNVNRFTITFSDDMVASESGGSAFGHSVLNPANYQFSQSGCTPSSYTARVVSFTCSTPLPTGNFVVTIPTSTATTGVWASGTSLGLAANVSKTFNLAAATGSTSVNLF